MSERRRHLVYTIALDCPGERGQRNLAKLLVSSLLRTGFGGEIVVFHTTPDPLFLVARAGVREVRLKLPRNAPRGPAFVAFAQSWKHEIGEHIDASAYGKIMFLDCDSLVLRNVDHLLEGEWDFAVLRDVGSRIQDFCWGGYLTAAERDTLNCAGFNSGSFAVRSERFHELLDWWRDVERARVRGFLREQSAFNRVVLDWDGALWEWDPREIVLPFAPSAHYRDCAAAAIVHAAGGGSPEERAQFLFGMFASVFLFDSQLMLFNVLEM